MSWTGNDPVGRRFLRIMQCSSRIVNKSKPKKYNLKEKHTPSHYDQELSHYMYHSYHKHNQTLFTEIYSGVRSSDTISKNETKMIFFT